MVTSAGSFDHNSYFNGASGMPTSAPYSQTQFQDAFDFSTDPSSAFGTFNYGNAGFTSVNTEMPPPQGSFESIAKRHKSSRSVGSPATNVSDTQSPNTGPPTPYNMAMPLTPNSSVGSDEPILRTTSKHSNSSYPPLDLRRMSVQSLINVLPGDASHQYNMEERGRQYPIVDAAFTIHGYDLGLPDYDTPNNNDAYAIAVSSPRNDVMNLDDDTTYGSAETRGKDMAFESGGYYAKPVAIGISKSLGALPPILMENPMNLLYFHHFLNHTARILVPHDCERNPFRQILPESMYSHLNLSFC